MQQQYADQGLQIINIHLDTESLTAARGKVLGFQLAGM